MSTPQFITPKSKWLTPYALECGYIECVIPNQKEIRMTLFKYAGCEGFHVRAHDGANHTRLFWETFETLSQARKFFRDKCGELNLNRKIPRE